MLNISFPSPIAWSISWSPRSIAFFFSPYISSERALITSHTVFMRWIDPIGTRSSKERRSQAGRIESASATNSRDHWISMSAGLRGSSWAWLVYAYAREKKTKTGEKRTGTGTGRGQGRGRCAHERLEGLREVVVDLLDERVERVPHHALPDELQRGAPHPRQDVHVPRAVLDSAPDRGPELKPIPIPSDLQSDKRRWIRITERPLTLPAMA